ncbi:hypothetical protein D3C81_2121400 [compost metagenome]
MVCDELTKLFSSENIFCYIGVLLAGWKFSNGLFDPGTTFKIVSEFHQVAEKASEVCLTSIALRISHYTE